MKRTQKFTLGTANLGGQYGITNINRFNESESREILKEALVSSVKSFDTAPDYGTAEDLLGEILPKNENLKVTTKIPKMTRYNIDHILESLEKSLVRTNQVKIHGLLFHDPDAHKISGLEDITRELLDTGKVEHVGFSAYTELDLLAGKARYPAWSIFQISENIADRSKSKSKALSDLAAEGNLIHTRSSFLQGLLLTPNEQVPSFFKEIVKFNNILDKVAIEYGVTRRDLCLSYTNRIKWSASTIIGAASCKQLGQNVNYVDIEIDFDFLPSLSREILDPRNWPSI